jgi:hypothetical protein
MSYLRFGAMIATSTLVMFGLMYLNTYALDHVAFSETRAYMAILMGATMAVIMMGYMFAMYPSRLVNVAILAGAVLVFALSLFLVRSQATIGQVSYMRAMIPHHSIAILTSNRATITDPRVRALADEIIEAQEREIAEMGYLIAALEGEIDAPPQRIPETEAPVVSSVAEALAHADLAVLTPAPLNPNEVARAQVGTPSCTFRYTADSPPVLVVGVGAEGTLNGVMKLNGALIPLRAPSPDALRPGGGAEMTADRVTMTVIPAPGEPVEAPGERELRADLVFALVEAQTVGYRGFYRCRA